MNATDTISACYILSGLAVAVCLRDVVQLVLDVITDHRH